MCDMRTDDRMGPFWGSLVAEADWGVFVSLKSVFPEHPANAATVKARTAITNFCFNNVLQS